jgi:hypothetical protein
VRMFAQHLPVTEEVHGKEFIAKKDGQRVATPVTLWSAPRPSWLYLRQYAGA